MRVKVLILVLAVLCFFAVCLPVVGSGTSDEKLLQEAVVRAKEVREFGRTLGIEPTEALSKSVLEQLITVYAWICVQQQGTLAWKKKLDSVISLPLEPSSDYETALLRVVRDKINKKEFDYFARLVTEYSDNSSVITLEFAKLPVFRQVPTVFHEDIHACFHDFPWEINESVTTALGFIAATEYFRHRDDMRSLFAVRKAIGRFCTYSRELTEIVKEAELVFADTRMSFDARRARIKRIIELYPLYHQRYRYFAQGLNANTLEAFLSHDIAYLSYFDRIIALYKRNPDFKSLVAKLKRAPHDFEGFEQYLIKLEQEN